MTAFHPIGILAGGPTGHRLAVELSRLGIPVPVFSSALNYVDRVFSLAHDGARVQE